jgi:hypothetical protein
VVIPEEAAWRVAESENPWKSSEPFTDSELAAMVSTGVAANPFTRLDFTPVQFSEDLVPAKALNLPPVTPGSFSLVGRSTRQFLTWLDEPGEIELKVTAGLMYRDRGNVKISLLSPKEATMEPVAYDESVVPDGNEYRIPLRSIFNGLHTLEVSDGNDRTQVLFPEGMPLTILSAMDNPQVDAIRDGNWSLYFYVPRGTKVVGGYSRGPSGVMRDGDGNVVLDFGQREVRAGYFNVPVPQGQDGRLWQIENAEGRAQKLLMTVPPYLARSEKELLLPREVVEADRPR